MAYDVLSDKTKKDKYDNFGKDGLQNMNHEGPDMGSFDIFNKWVWIYASIWAWLAIWFAWLWAWIWEWMLVKWALWAIEKNPESKTKIMTFKHYIFV